MKIGYVRVSTKEQNTIRQEKLMEELAVEKLYIEKVSGKSKDREQLNAMLEFAREGDTIIVESISRFARNTKDLLELIEVLQSKGIHFISQKEAIDTNTPTGKFMLTVFGAVSELERAYILDRQKEGIQAMPTNEEGKKVSMRTGRTTGRPNAEYPNQFEVVYGDWKLGKIKAVDAMKVLELKKTTFYKLVKQYEMN